MPFNWIAASGCRGRAAGLAVALALIPAGPGRAEEKGFFERTGDWFRSFGDTYEVVWPSTEDWRKLWTGLTTSLQSDSWEGLSGMKESTGAALEYLDHWPQSKPYADWLRQRMDYIEVAEEVIRIEKAAAEPKPVKPEPPPRIQPTKPLPPDRNLPVWMPVTNQPARPLPKPQAIVPQLKPAPAPPVPARVESRSRLARSEEIWKRKLERRAAPSDARDLVPRLKEVFRKEGIPEQLVWLAEVESTMDPSARSPVGAVGLFQMMSPTAKRFGLSTSPVDERLDPVRQAGAVAQYLRFLHGKFRSWPLALAAYNAGEGRIAKALKATGGRTFDDIASQLSVETQMYVPKISAILKLREGAQLDRLPAPRERP